MSDSYTVFISHTWDTKPLAEELANALENQGIESWVDFKNLRPGQVWREELDRAIDSARYFVFLLTPESRATPWQEHEWSAALERFWGNDDKKLLPVIFGNSDSPPFLRDWVPLRVDPRTDASVWTREVVDVLQDFRNHAVHGLDSRNRAERQRRFAELRTTAEQLREGQSDHPIAPSE